MRRPPDRPRWLLVVWPDSLCPSCIPLGDEAAAIAKKAIVIAREDAALVSPVVDWSPYMDRRKPKLKTDDGQD